MARSKRFGAVLGMIVVAGALLACKKDKEEGAAGASSAASGGGGDIGVPECDEYITKMEKCLAKMPGGGAAAKPGFDAMRSGWKQTAAGPGKSALAAGCKTALDTAKTSYASMGCEF
jgi:hypothetical protein